MQNSSASRRRSQEADNLETPPLRRSKSKKRVRKKEISLPWFQIVTFLWLSFLTYWIFYGMQNQQPPTQKQTPQAVPTPIIQRIYITEPTPTTTLTPTPTEQKEEPTITTKISTPEITPSTGSTQTRQLPTIYLLRTHEGDGLSAFQRYLLSALDIEDLNIQTLEYHSKEKEFFSNGQMVPASKLQQSITLFVFHLATPKITGTWDTELHSAIFKKSTGNCVWTSIKGSHPSELAERPVSPEKIRSGVNLFAEAYTLEKVLQFHTSQQDFIADNHNKINTDKLRKLIKAKQDAINI